MALFGVGMAGIAFATQAGAEDGNHILLENRGMILGTMAHLRSVKLREAPAIPAYIVNNADSEPEVPAIVEFITKYQGTTQLDILMSYPPTD